MGFFLNVHSIFTILDPSGKILPSAGRPCLYAFIITSFATITFNCFSVWLTATSSQFSYPLKSANDSLPNFSVYLSCAAMAMPPKTASMTAMIKIIEDGFLVTAHSFGLAACKSNAVASAQRGPAQGQRFGFLSKNLLG